MVWRYSLEKTRMMGNTARGGRRWGMMGSVRLMTRRSWEMAGSVGLTARELMGKDIKRLRTFFLMSGEDSGRTRETGEMREK
jgi:hypothetical protein